jgi:hypothetical protein
MTLLRLFFLPAMALVTFTVRAADTPAELRVGRAGHAFDHLGNISMQARAASASGATIIYASGLGATGYQGLPAPEKLAEEVRDASQYVRKAKASGIRLAIAYVCATSIVKLETFDSNWSPAFRARFHTPPREWQQQGRDGHALLSWYGGDYYPACMSNPDWRAYEKFIVRQQMETGHDGIFFDNPTVHPNGCYCPHCMQSFSRFLKDTDAGENIEVKDRSVEGLRRLAAANKQAFLRFRCTIARDFLAEMRTYARFLHRGAMVTCNNSLNSPGVFYSQCRNYGYNIHEMSRAEDFVVVEDMVQQPRTSAAGQTVEYAPVYHLLHAIAHGKPVVAATIAEGDYHTAPNLMRLAMAEAAANNASYLSWPTWPENERARMSASVRPQADLLRANEKLLNGTKARRDVTLFLPFRRWLDTDRCAALALATELSRANIQFEALCEDQFTLANLKTARPTPPVLVLESRSVLSDMEREILSQFEGAGGRVIAVDENKDWLMEIKRPGLLSLTMSAPETVRAVVRDQPGRTIIHLLNLNIQRLSSFQDRVQPAEGVRLLCRVPSSKVRSARVLTADGNSTSGDVHFSSKPVGKETVVEITLPRLDIAAILVIEY